MQHRGVWTGGSGRQAAGPAQQRRANLSLLLSQLRATGPRSRARLAEDTGLNKATVSSLVTELADRGLVRESGEVRDAATGRPGLLLEVDGRAVCGIGLEINVDYVAGTLLDLRGDVLAEDRVAADIVALPPAEAIDELAAVATRLLREAANHGAVCHGVAVAVPGLVDVASGTLRFAPNLRWHDVPIADLMAERLPAQAGPVLVDNDANLGAIAEYSMGSAAGTPDLVYITGEVGVGGGVIVGGRLLRGADGLSGEVGHMPLDPDGHLCGCGRRGCWETMVGLAALIRLAAGPDDAIRNPALDLEARLALVRERASGGDARTLGALRQVGAGLGVGGSVLVNLFNPRVLVLGGYFAALAEFVVPAALAELRERVVAPDLAGCRLEPSVLGFSAAGRGGAQIVLDTVLEDPGTVPLRATPEVQA